MSKTERATAEPKMVISRDMYLALRDENARLDAVACHYAVQITTLRAALERLVNIIESDHGADILPYNLSDDDCRDANEAMQQARAALAREEQSL